MDFFSSKVLRTQLKAFYVPSYLTEGLKCLPSFDDSTGPRSGMLPMKKLRKGKNI